VKHCGGRLRRSLCELSKPFLDAGLAQWPSTMGMKVLLPMAEVERHRAFSLSDSLSDGVFSPNKL